MQHPHVSFDIFRRFNKRLCTHYHPYVAAFSGLSDNYQARTIVEGV